MTRVMASNAQSPGRRAAARPPPLAQSQYETLAAFRYALRRFLHFSDAAAHSAGIAPQQYQALLAIKGFRARESVTVGKLAERLQLRHHSAVGLVDRLEAEKLAVRMPGAQDRRQVLIELTRRGQNVLEKLASVHREQLKRIGPEMTRLLARLHRTPRPKAPDPRS
jgi:DNA-binding MarR family transcriptional regulator